MKVLVKSMILFYNFDICNFRVVNKEKREVHYLPCNILNFDNLMNFTTVLMFPERIYSLVLRFLMAKNEARNKKYMSNSIKQDGRITMETLGIEDKFKLREDLKISNDDLLKVKINYSFHHPSKLIGSIIEEDDDESLIETRKLSEVGNGDMRRRTIMENLSQSRTSTILKKISSALPTPNDTSDDPYHEAIRTLQYISEVESPFEKMKVLLLVVRRIIKAINEFYGAKQLKQEVITGDQMMSLTVYVVLKSKWEFLYAYIEFIEAFLPSKMFGTFWGYYLTVFQASWEFITEFNENQPTAA